METANVIKFGIFEDFSQVFGTDEITNIIQLNYNELLISTINEIIILENNAIKIKYPLRLKTITIIPETNYLIGISNKKEEIEIYQFQGILNIQKHHKFTSKNSPTLIKKFQTKQTNIFNIFYSPKSKSIITFSAEIKVFTLQINPGKKKNNIIINDRSTFPNRYNPSSIASPQIDTNNELIFLPTESGICGFNFDGEKVCQLTKNPSNQKTVFSVIQSETNAINSMSSLTYDDDYGMVLWNKNQQVHKFDTIRSSVLSINSIDSENSICLNSCHILFYLNRKTGKTFYYMNLNKNPTKLFIAYLYNEPVLCACFGSKLRVLNLVIPWKVWQLNIEKTLSMTRCNKFMSAARILVAIENSFLKIFSPRNGSAITVMTPHKKIKPALILYDRGTAEIYAFDKERKVFNVEVVQIGNGDDFLHDFLYIIQQNGQIICLDVNTKSSQKVVEVDCRAVFMSLCKMKDENGKFVWCFAVASEKGEIFIIDYFTLKKIAKFDLSETDSLTQMFFDFEFGCLVLVFPQKTILFDVDAGAEIDSLSIEGNKAVSLFGNFLIYGYDDGQMKKVDIEEKRLVKDESFLRTSNKKKGRLLKPHSCPVTGFSFSSKIWISSGLDGNINVWNYSFEMVSRISLPLPLRSCLIMNGKHDILVATATEIMMIKSDFIFYKVENFDQIAEDEEGLIDPEVKEIDNFDRMKDLNPKPKNAAQKNIEEENELVKNDDNAEVDNEEAKFIKKMRMLKLVQKNEKIEIIAQKLRQAKASENFEYDESDLSQQNKNAENGNSVASSKSTENEKDANNKNKSTENEKDAKNKDKSTDENEKDAKNKNKSANENEKQKTDSSSKSKNEKSNSNENKKNSKKIEKKQTKDGESGDSAKSSADSKNKKKQESSENTETAEKAMKSNINSKQNSINDTKTADGATESIDKSSDSKILTELESNQRSNTNSGSDFNGESAENNQKDISIENRLDDESSEAAKGGNESKEGLEKESEKELLQNEESSNGNGGTENCIENGEENSEIIDNQINSQESTESEKSQELNEGEAEQSESDEKRIGSLDVEESLINDPESQENELTNTNSEENKEDGENAIKDENSEISSEFQDNGNEEIGSKNGEEFNDEISNENQINENNNEDVIIENSNEDAINENGNEDAINENGNEEIVNDEANNENAAEDFRNENQEIINEEEMSKDSNNDINENDKDESINEFGTANSPLCNDELSNENGCNSANLASNSEEQTGNESEEEMNSSDADKSFAEFDSRIARSPTPSQIRPTISNVSDSLSDPYSYENKRSRTPSPRRTYRSEYEFKIPANIVIDKEAVLALYGRGRLEFKPYVDQIQREFLVSQYGENYNMSKPYRITLSCIRNFTKSIQKAPKENEIPASSPRRRFFCSSARTIEEEMPINKQQKPVNQNIETVNRKSYQATSKKAVLPPLNLNKSFSPTAYVYNYHSNTETFFNTLDIHCGVRTSRKLNSARLPLMITQPKSPKIVRPNASSRRVLPLNRRNLSPTYKTGEISPRRKFNASDSDDLNESSSK